MLEQDAEIKEEPGVGDVIDERYALFEKLGVESDANVFRARHIPSRDFVHLYLFGEVELEENGDDESRPHVDEFKLQALKSFFHANVVRVREVDRAFGNRRFIAYQEVEAPTLREVLQQKGALDNEHALRIMHGVLDALAAGHARGLVHGRLTPDSILLTGSDGAWIPKVREFGVVTVLDLDDLPELSVDVAYMAPEQLQGAPPSVQSDLYTWGIILAETLSGRPVFLETEGNITGRQLSEDEVPLPEGLDDGVANLLQRAVLKDPEERYRSADELFYAVAQLQHGHFGANAAALVGTGSHPAFTEFGTKPNFDAPGSGDAAAEGQPRALRSLDGSIKKPGQTGETPSVDSAPSLSTASASPSLSTAGATSQAGLDPASGPAMQPVSGPAMPPVSGLPHDDTGSALPWIILSAVAAIVVLGAVFYLVMGSDSADSTSTGTQPGNLEPSEESSSLPAAPALLARVYEASLQAPTLLREAVEQGISTTRRNKEPAAPDPSACNDAVSDSCIDWTWWALQQPEADHKLAVEKAQQRCTDEKAAGCASLGIAHRTGRGVEQSREKTLELLERACQAEHGRGCLALGQVYEAGFGVDASNPRAAEWYRKGCELNNQSACTGFGRMLDGVKNVHADFERALSLFSSACSAGHGEGCERLARMHEKGRGVTPDIARSQELLQKSCDLGYGEACRQLGYALRAADDANDVSLTRAADLYVRGCDLGNGKSCDGACYFALSGEGMPKNAENAYRWCDKACSLNDPDGCYRFGVILRDGVGTESDYGRAREMFEKACAGGNQDGCDRVKEE